MVHAYRRPEVVTKFVGYSDERDSVPDISPEIDKRHDCSVQVSVVAPNSLPLLANPAWSP